MRDYYQLLGVTPQVRQLEIKRAFRKLALQYHPDKNTTPEAEKKIRTITLAYKTLSDPIKRAKYDMSLNDAVEINSSSFTPEGSRRGYVQHGEGLHTHQLMKIYLPYFKWTCWVGLALTLLLAIDYMLPTNQVKEKIVHIEDVYSKLGKGIVMFDHAVLTTDNGRKFNIFDRDVNNFKNQPFLWVYNTPLLFDTIAITPEKGEHKVSISLIYGNLFFIPLVLFITSVLGLVNQDRVEWVFNFSIVTSVLLAILIYLILT